LSVLHAPRKPDIDRRLFWFPFVILSTVFLLLSRLWFLQVFNAQNLREQSQITKGTSTKRLAPRGAIYDRNGVLIAGIEPQLVVTIKPGEAKKHPEVVQKLAGMLGLSEEEIKSRIADQMWRPQVPAPVKVGVDIVTATKIAESGDLLGVQIDEKPMRKYRDTTHFSHVLGYVWTPNDKDEKRLKDKSIEPAEYVGKSGIEMAYEADLMGQEGKSTIQGRGKSKYETQESAIPGKQINLSINASLQAYTQELMKARGLRGSVVAIEPATGEILAMVSSPTFDTKLFEGGISTENLKLLNADSDARPQINRAIGGCYEPGSTFKIVTSIAAYRANKVSRSTTVYCNGGYTFNGRGKPIKCLGHHGAIAYTEAMAKSCNTYFITLGIRAGKEQVIQSALDVGLGSPTGIELLGERSGSVPTFSAKTKSRTGTKFNTGDLANMALGQGMVNTSPIQMANLAALVANNGVSYRPHLVRSMRDPLTGKDQRVAPVQSHVVKAEPWFWDMLKDALTGVIGHGTAKSAQIGGVEWAGKTGSAEHGLKDGKTHGWFVGFAPRKNPKIAICILAESAGHGGDIAAPIAKEVVVHYFNTLSRAASKAGSSTVRSSLGSGR
jgi:penicillin-binding protein 2